MRITNFLRGAITSAKLTPCQEAQTQRGKLEKSDQADVLKIPNHSRAGSPAPESHRSEHPCLKDLGTVIIHPSLQPALSCAMNCKDIVDKNE